MNQESNLKAKTDLAEKAQKYPTLNAYKCTNTSVQLSEDAQKFHTLAVYHFELGDYQLAAVHHGIAAEEGHPDSQYQVARYYHKGLNEYPKNTELAMEWYRKAAEQGHRAAREEYDQLAYQHAILARSDDTLSGEEFYQKARYYYSSGDYRQAAHYHLMAANGGYYLSQYETARYYHLGLYGFNQDLEVARLWYQKAAEQGHSEAFRALEALTAQMEALSKQDDDLSSEELHQKALHFYKIGNSKESARYHLLAAEAGCADSQYQIGRIYQSGIFGFEQNSSLAMQWYQKAMKQGNADAKREYQELSSYMKLLDQSENSLSPEELYFVAKYYRGIGEFRKEAKYHLMAAEAGWAESQYRIGTVYRLGLYRYEQNVQKAMEWFKKAADQGHRLAKEEHEKLQNGSTIYDNQKLKN
jgi:TPR repeat protein